MENALREPATMVVFGGTSDIGLAIVRELLSPATRVVVLACRDVGAGEECAALIRHDSLTVEVVAFDALDASAPGRVVDALIGRHGDLDVAIVAHGQLGDPASTTTDPIAAAQLIAVNTASTIASTVAAGGAMRRQGHGDIVVVSSVAGERVRSANPIYGGSKAGLDGFAQGYGDLVAPDGVHVLVVRPGFVHSAMTTGLRPAPFATTPEVVARDTVRALRSRRRMAWSPGILRYVFSALRHVPAPVWRRLPLG